MRRQSRAADLLLRLLDQQQDEGILWSRCRADGTLISELSDVPQKNWRYVRVSASEPEQAYWIWAWPMNELIAVYELTHAQQYFDAAVKIFDFLAGCHEDAFGFTTAGKDAWGAAKLFRLTGDTRYLDKAMLQFQYILDHQHADGYMLGEGVADESGQPKRTSYDYTADFTSASIHGAAELASRGL